MRTVCLGSCPSKIKATNLNYAQYMQNHGLSDVIWVSIFSTSHAHDVHAFENLP